MRILALLVLAALTLAAAPNFQGTFKLNVSRSDFGPFPAPAAMTQQITHQDPNLSTVTKMSTDQGDFDFEFRCTTDGKECTNAMGPNSMKSTAKWQGDALLVEGKGNFGDSDVTMVDKWELSEDGKVLTINRKWSSDRGELIQKLILEKQ